MRCYFRRRKAVTIDLSSRWWPSAGNATEGTETENRGRRMLLRNCPTSASPRRSPRRLLPCPEGSSRLEMRFARPQARQKAHRGVWGEPPQTAAEPPHPCFLRLSEDRRNRRTITAAEPPHPFIFNELRVRRIVLTEPPQNRRKAQPQNGVSSAIGPGPPTATIGSTGSSGSSPYMRAASGVSWLLRFVTP